jgi:cobalt/nickel transport system ATP-binding protein
LPPLFSLQNVTYRYGEIVALRDLSLDIERGQRVALLGANGSGKSTLLRLLDALVFPHEGDIRFEGELISEARFDDAAFSQRFRQRVGLVFQNPDVQLFNPTVFDELAFGPLQLGWTKAQILEGVDRISDRLGIAHLRHRAPHRLSGGEKKRVALASVLILDPDVLLLDEPTAALDPQSQNTIVELLANWSQQRTVVTATHDLHIVEDIADMCFVFEGGTLSASGTAAQILNDEALLRRAHLLHAHRHTHDSGITHIHPHLHHHEH